MVRHLPSFSAMRAFEAAARHLSFKRAAEELCVTASAISHQISTLEDYLGQPMFVRRSNRLFLTKAGLQYQGELTAVLDQLAKATGQARTEPETMPLRVLATPGFAARWLVPRLDRCPGGGNLRISVSDQAPDTDFGRNDADLVVQWGDAPSTGIVVEPFMQSARFPVASPALAKTISRTRDLLDQTIFRDEVGDAWAEWFAMMGTTGFEDNMGGGRVFPIANCP